MTSLVPLLLAYAMGPAPGPSVTIYAAQGRPKAPGLTHTWAVYSCPGRADFCISWMPAKGPVRVGRGAVAGRNWTLAVTWDWCRKHHLRVRQWRRDLTAAEYAAAAARYRDLVAGKYRYRAVPGRGCHNCTSAACGRASLKHGFAGGREAVR